MAVAGIVFAVGEAVGRARPPLPPRDSDGRWRRPGSVPDKPGAAAGAARGCFAPGTEAAGAAATARAPASGAEHVRVVSCSRIALRPESRAAIAAEHGWPALATAGLPAPDRGTSTSPDTVRAFSTLERERSGPFPAWPLPVWSPGP